MLLPILLQLSVLPAHNLSQSITLRLVPQLLGRGSRQSRGQISNLPLELVKRLQTPKEVPSSIRAVVQSAGTHIEGGFAYGNASSTTGPCINVG